MRFFSYLSGKKKSIFFLMFFGFLIKYNYLNWNIFQISSISALISKNLIVLATAFLIANLSFRSKKGIYLTLSCYLFFTIFFFANLWYNKYFGNYLSVADITMGQGVRPIKVLVRQLVGWIDLLFILEFPFLAYLIYSIRRENNLTSRNKTPGRKQIIIIILIIAVLVSGHFFYTSSLYAKKGFLELYEHSTPAFVSVYGIIPSYFAEFYVMQTRGTKTSVEDDVDESEVTIEKDLSQTYNLSNVENIIVIQLESFDEKIIDYQYNGKELTPFINKIKSESLYFNNIYAQHINGSFDAEFSFLNSIYPINRNYAFETNDMSEFNSLLNVLDNKSFENLAFHGNKGDFFSRDKGYPEIGFDYFYSKSNFSVEKGLIGKDTYLGINDYDFFDQSIEYLKAAKNPFFAFFITVTSHTPFDFYPEDYSVEEFKDLNPPIVKDYFNSVHFTDLALKNFFRRLKNNGLFEDTLFILYSDHTSEIRKESYSSAADFIMEGNVNIKEPENIPLIIYHPELNAKTINKTGTHTDIAPTILDLLGVKEKPEGFLGVSLLKKKENSVLFLDEMPQILYHDTMFLKLPDSPENELKFKRIAYKDEKSKVNKLPESEKERMVDTINYVQEIIKKTVRNKE